MVLYRKYRPQTLADVIGQEHVREPLLASFKSGKISHAFLLNGPRGTGKTSVARILAKVLNCQTNKDFGEPCNRCSSCSAIAGGSYLDLLEIDAASNRGIDEIRDLREKIKLSPALGKYKVYIIDEAHMLTPEAFNALLKTLEEPPEHAVFVLATTEPQKIPATIASRTTRYDFKVPTVEQIKEKLSLISEKEKWSLPGDSLEEIAKMAGGAFRDGEVLLEKVASVDTTANLQKTREILGKKEFTTTVNFLELINLGQTKEALIWLDNYVQEGGSVRILAESVLDALRKTLLIKVGATSVLGVVTEEELECLKAIEKKLTKARVLELTTYFNRTIEELRDATIPQLPLEIAIIEATLEIDTAVNKQESTGIINTQIDNNILESKVIKAEKPKPTKKVREKESRVEKKTNPGDKKVVSQSRLLAKLQKKWSMVLKEVKLINSSLEMFLRGAKPVDLDEDLLTIEFGYRFHKEKVEERKYRDVVEKVLGKIAGAPLRMKGAVAPKMQEEKKKQQPEPLEKKEEADPAQVFGTLD